MPDLLASSETAAWRPGEVEWGPSGMAQNVVRRTLPPRAADLLALLAAAAQSLQSAAGEGGPHRRASRLVAPLHEPGTWLHLMPQLQHLLFRLTRQRLRLEATGTPAGACRLEAPVALQNVTAVLVLSPSLSSLAGAVAALQTGRHPLLVLAAPRRHDRIGQADRALEVLQEGFPGIPCLWAVAGPDRPSAPLHALSILRSLARAAAVAEMLGLSEVQVPEDVTATLGVFEPLRPPQCHPLHPENLASLNELLAAAGFRCRLSNPLGLRTPCETAQEFLRPALQPRHLQDLLPLSDDCSGEACGRCVLQQLSLLPLSQGRLDAEQGDSPLSEGCLPDRSCLVSTLQCLLDLCRLNDAELVARFPSLLRGVRSAEDLGLVQTCRRSARQARALLQQYWPEGARLLQ